MIHRYEVPDHPVIREMELYGERCERARCPINPPERVAVVGRLREAF